MYQSVAIICKNEEEARKLMEKHGSEFKVEPYIYTTVNEAVKQVDYRTQLIINQYKEELKEIEGKDSKEALELMNEIEKYEGWLNWSEEEKLNKYKNGYNMELFEDGKGNLLTTYNEEAKWTDYEIGGVFEEYLPIKDDKKEKYGCKAGDPCYVAVADLEDVNFFNSFSVEEKVNLELIWYVMVEEENIQSEERDDLLGRYLSKDNFIKENTTITTNAILLPNGEWHDDKVKSFIGRYASKESSREFFENYFNILDLDKYKGYKIFIAGYEPYVG